MAHTTWNLDASSESLAAMRWLPAVPLESFGVSPPDFASRPFALRPILPMEGLAGLWRSSWTGASAPSRVTMLFELLPLLHWHASSSPSIPSFILCWLSLLWRTGCACAYLCAVTRQATRPSCKRPQVITAMYDSLEPTSLPLGCDLYLRTCEAHS